MTTPQVGPELDAAVCRVLGIPQEVVYEGEHPWGAPALMYAPPPVSTDWTAMRLVLGALCERGHFVHLSAPSGAGYKGFWWVTIDTYVQDDDVQRDLPQAICEAALAALSQEGSE